MEFTWDDAKAESNQRKHGVTFEEAVTAYSDNLGRVIDDFEHSEIESREILIGLSSSFRLLFVSFLEIESIIPIISARLATAAECREHDLFLSGRLTDGR